MNWMRRTLALLALVGLAPLAWSVVWGRTSAGAAGVRALVLLIAVLVLHRVLVKAVLAFADTLDGTWRGSPVEVVEETAGVDE